MPGEQLHQGDRSLYDVLSVDATASAQEIKRAYRTLATKLHPDKAGASAKVEEGLPSFHDVQQAFTILNDPLKRKLYDATGTWQRGADEEFVAAFAKGNFNTRSQVKAVEPAPRLDQLIIRQTSLSSSTTPSHGAGFEAWLRSRGEEGGVLFTADTAAQQFGVVRSSYDAVALPACDVPMVCCKAAGKPCDVLGLTTQPLPSVLEWGQVLVEWRYAPINPADLYSARLGGVYGKESAAPPYIAGHDGVGVIFKVGPGVKSLFAGDLVLPARSFLGTWRAAAVVPETDLLRLPASITSLIKTAVQPTAPGNRSSTDSRTTSSNSDEAYENVTPRPDGAGMEQSGTERDNGSGVGCSVEVLALAREMCTAYLLLERYGGLKPGDCVLVNAPTSIVGATLMQLAKLLQLRAVAVVRAPHTAHATQEGAISTEKRLAEAWSRTEARFKALGATVVLKDEGSLKVALESMQFFAKPKLALDAVGGDSAVRLADALADGGEIVSYGCMSGKAPIWPWQNSVFREIRVSGFNLRRWLQHSSNAPSTQLLPNPAAAAKKLTAVLEPLLKLVAAGLLTLSYTEYELSEFADALDHAQAPGRWTKVLLRMPAVMSQH